MIHGGLTALRPAACRAAALGLVFGLLGAGSALAGATPRSQPVTNFAAYVGGHGKANSKLSPITIGVVNQQTAADAISPTWTTGVKVAEDYINQHAGGIDGHPVKLVLCKIPTTVSAAASCGYEFADNSAIDAIAVGGVIVGNTALESALRSSKKPTFFGVSLSSTDEKDRWGFILYGDATHLEAPWATFAKTYLHAKSVSLVYPSDIAGEVTSANIIYDALKYEGIKTIYKVGFTSADTNLTEPLEAAHVGSTTVLMAVNSGGTACSDTYLTLKSLGLTKKTKVIVNGPCATPTIAKADGGQLPHDWYYVAGSPVAGSGTKAIPVMDSIFTEYGKGPLAANPWSSIAFSQVLTIAKLDTEILKAGKKITPATVFTAARAFKGPVVWGSAHIDCGGFPGTPAVCNDLVNFYRNTSPNVMKTVDRSVGQPKGFTAP